MPGDVGSLATLAPSDMSMGGGMSASGNGGPNNMNKKRGRGRAKASSSSSTSSASRKAIDKRPRVCVRAYRCSRCGQIKRGHVCTATQDSLATAAALAAAAARRKGRPNKTPDELPLSLPGRCPTRTLACGVEWVCCGDAHRCRKRVRVGLVARGLPALSRPRATRHTVRIPGTPPFDPHPPEGRLASNGAAEPAPTGLRLAQLPLPR